MPIKIRLAVCCLFAIIFCWSSVIHFTTEAQEQKPPTPAPSATPTPSDGFGNVQVLKGVRDLLPTMHFMRASLGVRCDYCHITEINNYYRDDKPAKRRAREMIIMTRQLNQAAFGGKQVITCNTCHRGSPKPVAIPQIATNFVNTTRVEPFEPPPPTYPGAGEIFARYEAATRASTLGPANLRVEINRGKLMNGNTGSGYMVPRGLRVITESIVDGERGTASLPQATGQMLRVGSIGKRLWYIGPNGPQWVTNVDVEQLKRKINPLLVLRVRAADYSSTTTGEETANGIDCYVVNATVANGMPETLWFSKRDGSLIRRTYYFQTLLGPEPEQYNLSEYKRFGAIRVPMVINTSYLDDQHLGVLRRILSFKFGITVADKDFEPPER